MRRALTFLVGVCAAALLLTALMPGQAQDATPFPPEATVVPEGAVYGAPGNCTVSPDESQIALNGYAVFSLPTGEKRYDIAGSAAVYSPDGRYLSTVKGGLYDAQTGEQLIDSSAYPNNFDVFERFSPDGSLYIDTAGVYETATGEQLIPLDTTYSADEPSASPQFLANGDIIIYYQFPNVDIASRHIQIVVHDAKTRDVIFDIDEYGVTLGYASFNPDMSRVAISGVGVFAYPEMTKVYDLPTADSVWRSANFSDDGAIISLQGISNQELLLGFLDAETGDYINQFVLNIPNPLPMERLLYLSPNLTKLAFPNLSQVGTGRDTIYTIYGWRIIDVRTNALIKEFTTNDVDGVRAEIYGEPSDLDPNSKRFEVNGRYVTSEGVFDVATDALILPLAGFNSLALTNHATYAVSQNPCTVWLLP